MKVELPALGRSIFSQPRSGLVCAKSLWNKNKFGKGLVFGTQESRYFQSLVTPYSTLLLPLLLLNSFSLSQLFINFKLSFWRDTKNGKIKFKIHISPFLSIVCIWGQLILIEMPLFCICIWIVCARCAVCCMYLWF